MGDRHVSGGVARRRLDGYIVVSGVDEAVRDGHVGCIAGIDGIGVPGIARSVHDDAPGGEAIPAVVGDVEIRRVFQLDAVQREVVAVRQDQDARIILDSPFSRLLGQIPPGDILPHDLRAAASVDHSVTHDRRAGYMVPVEDCFAAVASLGDGSADSGLQIVVARIPGC